MSAYLNMVEGMKALEIERKHREVYFRNEEEKQAREMIEQQASADSTPEEKDADETGTPAHEFVFPEGMSDKDKLLLMTSAITNLTNTIKGENN